MAGTSTASRAASREGLRIVSMVASKPTSPSFTDDIDDDELSSRPREALRADMLAQVARRERSDAIPRFEGSDAMVHVGEVEAAARGLSGQCRHAPGAGVGRGRKRKEGKGEGKSLT